MITKTDNKGRVTPQLQWEVEQFLYEEGALIDERRFRDWLDHLAKDLRYIMPIKYNRLPHERDQEIGSVDELCYFDETWKRMERRVRKLETGMAWAEEPPSRTRHLLTNIRVRPTENADEYETLSCFHVYRSRNERQVENFIGNRRDIVRRADTALGWQVVRREIYLDQAILLANNISFFF